MAKTPGDKPQRKPASPPARQGRGRGDTPPRGAEEPRVHFLPPLKPRPGLLIATSAVFALWLGFLLVLRFTTVAGHGHEQHPHDEPAQGQRVSGAVAR